MNTRFEKVQTVKSYCNTLKLELHKTEADLANIYSQAVTKIKNFNGFIIKTIKYGKLDNNLSAILTSKTTDVRLKNVIK